MIYIAQFYDTSKHHGQTFSIAVSEPDSERFPKLNCFVPPEKIVWGFKSGEISWQEYSDIYLQYLNQQENEIIEEVYLLMQYNPITLCCWETNYTQCHRSLVAKWLDEHNINYNLN